MKSNFTSKKQNYSQGNQLKVEQNRKCDKTDGRVPTFVNNQ